MPFLRPPDDISASRRALMKPLPAGGFEADLDRALFKLDVPCPSMYTPPHARDTALHQIANRHGWLTPISKPIHSNSNALTGQKTRFDQTVHDPAHLGVGIRHFRADLYNLRRFDTEAHGRNDIVATRSHRSPIRLSATCIPPKAQEGDTFRNEHRR